MERAIIGVDSPVSAAVFGQSLDQRIDWLFIADMCVFPVQICLRIVKLKYLVNSFINIICTKFPSSFSLIKYLTNLIDQATGVLSPQLISKLGSGDQALSFEIDWFEESYGEYA